MRMTFIWEACGSRAIVRAKLKQQTQTERRAITSATILDFSFFSYQVPDLFTDFLNDLFRYIFDKCNMSRGNSYNRKYRSKNTENRVVLRGWRSERKRKDGGKKRQRTKKREQEKFCYELCETCVSFFCSPLLFRFGCLLCLSTQHHTLSRFIFFFRDSSFDWLFIIMNSTSFFFFLKTFFLNWFICTLAIRSFSKRGCFFLWSLLLFLTVFFFFLVCFYFFLLHFFLFLHLTPSPLSFFYYFRQKV